MLKVHNAGSIAGFASCLWLIVGLDKAVVVPFASNDRFGDVYAERSPIEISMLMAASSLGAAST